MIFTIIIIFIICVTPYYEHRMGEIGLVPQNTVDDLIKQKFEAPLPRFENFAFPRAYIQRRGSILAWIVILSVYGADTIAIDLSLSALIS
jgi:hypothetical protein